MSGWLVLALLSPFLLLVLVVGAVIVVALVQAREEDVPSVVEHTMPVFWWISRKLPGSAVARLSDLVTRGEASELNDAEGEGSEAADGHQV